MTALPPYETSEAVLHEHFKDVAIAVATMVCHTSRWPCKLPTIVLAAEF